MNIKKIFASVLKKLSESMVTVSPASAAGWGIEEMPESMKKLR